MNPDNWTPGRGWVIALVHGLLRAALCATAVGGVEYYFLETRYYSFRMPLIVGLEAYLAARVLTLRLDGACGLAGETISWAVTAVFAAVNVAALASVWLYLTGPWDLVAWFMVCAVLGGSVGCFHTLRWAE